MKKDKLLATENTKAKASDGKTTINQEICSNKILVKSQNVSIIRSSPTEK